MVERLVIVLCSVIQWADSRCMTNCSVHHIQTGKKNTQTASDKSWGEGLGTRLVKRLRSLYSLLAMVILILQVPLVSVGVWSILQQ